MFRNLIAAELVALVLSLGLPAPVAAGPFEDASAAYDRGDYTTALRLLSPLADQGDPRAQYSLGRMFDYDGQRGVPPDYAVAVTWYRKAADQGNARAQYALGFTGYGCWPPHGPHVGSPASGPTSGGALFACNAKLDGAILATCCFAPPLPRSGPA